MDSRSPQQQRSVSYQPVNEAEVGENPMTAASVTTTRKKRTRSSRNSNEEDEHSPDPTVDTPARKRTKRVSTPQQPVQPATVLPSAKQQRLFLGDDEDGDEEEEDEDDMEVQIIENPYAAAAPTDHTANEGDRKMSALETAETATTVRSPDAPTAALANPPVVAGAAAATAAHPPRVLPIEVLRMPSQRTPGKVRETKILETRYASAELDEDTSQVVAAPPLGPSLLLGQAASSSKPQTKITYYNEQGEVSLDQGAEDDPNQRHHDLPDIWRDGNAGVGAERNPQAAPGPLYLRMTTMVRVGYTSVVTTLQQMVMPSPPAEPTAAAAAIDQRDPRENATLDEAAPAAVTVGGGSPSALFYFFFILVLHALFYPIVLNPILPTLFGLVDETLTLYERSVLGHVETLPVSVNDSYFMAQDVVPSQAEVTTDDEEEETDEEENIEEEEEDDDQYKDDPDWDAIIAELNSTEVDESALGEFKEQLQAQMAAQMELLGHAEVDLQQARQSLLNKVDEMESSTQALRDFLAMSSDHVDSSAQRVVHALHTLEALVTQDKITGSPQLQEMKGHLGSAQRILVDLSPLKLWPIEDSRSCEDLTERDPKLDQEEEPVDLHKHLDELTAEILNRTAELMFDAQVEHRIVAWVVERSNETLPELPPPPPPPPQRTNKVPGSSIETIRNVIAAYLELEHADQTGLVDYGSVVRGAVVIRSGKHRTSPSLVDKLPLVNRVGALLSLRFYGYGPEAALTPTNPPNSLGQCWSFPKDRENKYSSFAMLSVQLARQIYVEKISIEHPPREISDKTSSSIRSFRLLGFEDENASGKAWALGSFEYKKGGPPRQEFAVEDEVHGVDVPPLKSVTLAIDSNWGMKTYACLYRFRVHGKEP